MSSRPMAIDTSNSFPSRSSEGSVHRSTSCRPSMFSRSGTTAVPSLPRWWVRSSEGPEELRFEFEVLFDTTRILRFPGLETSNEEYVLVVLLPAPGIWLLSSPVETGPQHAATASSSPSLQVRRCAGGKDVQYDYRPGALNNVQRSSA